MTEFAYMADHLSSALPSLANTSSILNHLKRERIFFHTALPSVAEIVNFRRRALTAKRKKVEISQKKAKHPRLYSRSISAKIAESIVIWWAPETRKIANSKRDRGAPFLTRSKTGLLYALKI